MKQIFLAILICLISALLPAQTAIWTGLGDGLSWEDPDNWMPDQVPQTGDSTVIANDSVVLHSNTDVKSLFLKLNATLTLLSQAHLKFSGSLNYALSLDNSKIYNSGTIQVLDVGNNEFEDRAVYLRNNSTFHNDGMCLIDKTNGHGIVIRTGSDFQNHAVVTIHTEDNHAITVIDSNSTFTNFRDLSITENGQYSRCIQINTNGLFSNTGTISMQISGFASYGIAAISSGNFTNSGHIEIVATSDAIGIGIAGNSSHMEITDGSVNIQLDTANGISISTAKLTIDFIATVTVTGTVSNFRLDIDSGAELDCQGTLDLQ